MSETIVNFSLIYCYIIYIISNSNSTMRVLLHLYFYFEKNFGKTLRGKYSEIFIFISISLNYIRNSLFLFIYC